MAFGVRKNNILFMATPFLRLLGWLLTTHNIIAHFFSGITKINCKLRFYATKKASLFLLIFTKSSIKTEIKPVKSGKIIRRGFRSADQLEGAVRMEQDFC